MAQWVVDGVAWVHLAEQKMAGLLHLVGQDNELATWGALSLVALVVLALAWVTLLSVVKGFLALIGIRGAGPREEGFGGRRQEMGFAARSVAPSAGRLDISPTAASVVRRPAASAARAPQAVNGEARAAVATSEPRTEVRLSQAAGGARSDSIRPPRPEDSPFRQVKMRALPSPVERGTVVSARPEWTGKVVPSSLQDAGAVEVCRVLMRRTPRLPGAETVRAVDYRVCGLPRVDGEGRRQPDVLVYTAADRGFLPKGAPSQPGRS